MSENTEQIQAAAATMKLVAGLFAKARILAEKLALAEPRPTVLDTLDAVEAYTAEVVQDVAEALK
jgi:hypothetical protein